jgi:hypothetical protein
MIASPHGFCRARLKPSAFADTIALTFVISCPIREGAVGGTLPTANVCVT